MDWGQYTVNPGVSIGDNTVIGSGSVVTKEIPANVIAAGNPCRVIRQLNEADTIFWKQRQTDYWAEAIRINQNGMEQMND